MFNKDRGFGFIIGEDKESYFFHISEVQFMQESIATKIAVTFVPQRNDKGLVATEINIYEKENVKPKVLVINEERIFVSKIKNYSIEERAIIYRNSQKDGFFIFQTKTPEQLFSRYYFKYLFIKTTDGNTYRYYSDDIANEKVSNLCSYFANRDLAYASELEKRADRELSELLTDYTYTSEDIKDIVNKIDGVFNLI